MAIVFDAGSNSGVKASVSAPYTFTHTAGVLTNGLIGIVVLARGGAISNSDLNLSAVSYNSVAATKAVEVNTADSPSSNTLVVSIWYLVAPASGANTVSVTHTGSVTTSVAYAITLAGVDQANPLDATASNHALGVTTSVSNNITTVADNAWIIDGIYQKIGTALTRGANQTLIAAETFPNGGGDTADTSYKGPVTPAGSTAMAWSWSGTDDYAQALASFKPAAAAGGGQAMWPVMTGNKFRGPRFF